MSKPILERIADLDWEGLHQTLDEQGFAAFPPTLSAEECRDLIETYDQPLFFRSTIQMARYRFGIGEYKYYQSPLPDLLQELREGFYPQIIQAENFC